MEKKVWDIIKAEAEQNAKSEQLLASFLAEVILKHKHFGEALSYLLAEKLTCSALPAIAIKELFDGIFKEDATILRSSCKDLKAVMERDPAFPDISSVFLYSKGFHSLQSYRCAHFLWNQDRKGLALFLQNRISEVFAVDIHPAAKIGAGILIDHATSVVVGETAIIEDDVSLLHEVTLGGTGKEHGDRHPKVRKNVLIGAGAKILGNIEIGEGAKIGAGSVVLDAVAPHTTVAGVPAKLIGRSAEKKPAMAMEHRLEQLKEN